MPKTLHLRADLLADIEIAAGILRRGGLVAFPTETVYGLGANALDAKAVRRIFEAKQRPSWDPLIVHVAEAGSLTQLTISEPGSAHRVQRLGDRYWPGPLTLLLPRSPAVPDEVTAGRSLVGVRVPAHPAAQSLLRAANVPVAAPSGNRFGHVSPTTAQHVFEDLEGRIDAVLDGGPTPVGLESTVVDPSQTPMVIYRAGAITSGMLATCAGAKVEHFHSVQENVVLEPEALPSPGVGLRHYAPKVPLQLCGPTEGALQATVAAALRDRNKTVGVLLPRTWSLKEQDRLEVVLWGSWEDPASLAAGLYAGLRALEDRQVGLIVCPLPEAGEQEEALRDRLSKAARPS